MKINVIGINKEEVPKGRGCSKWSEHYKQILAEFAKGNDAVKLELENEVEAKKLRLNITLSQHFKKYKAKNVGNILFVTRRD